jgi:hypothetical protein
VKRSYSVLAFYEIFLQRKGIMAWHVCLHYLSSKLVIGFQLFRMSVYNKSSHSDFILATIYPVSYIIVVSNFINEYCTKNKY